MSRPHHSHPQGPWSSGLLKEQLIAASHQSPRDRAAAVVPDRYHTTLECLGPDVSLIVNAPFRQSTNLRVHERVAEPAQ